MSGMIDLRVGIKLVERIGTFLIERMPAKTYLILLKESAWT